MVFEFCSVPLVCVMSCKLFAFNMVSRVSCVTNEGLCRGEIRNHLDNVRIDFFCPKNRRVGSSIPAPSSSSGKMLHPLMIPMGLKCLFNMQSRLLMMLVMITT